MVTTDRTAPALIVAQVLARMGELAQHQIVAIALKLVDTLALIALNSLAPPILANMEETA